MMKKRLVWMVCVTLSFLWMAGGLTPSAVAPKAQAFGTAILKIGSEGKDVIELQGRLKFLGYHKGTIDGQFGWGTDQSLKRFQRAFGMPVDGIAGSKVKLKLWSATKSYRPGSAEANALKAFTSGGTVNDTPVKNANSLSAEDLKMLQRVVYGEARGEPYEGQVAVAAVVLNRITNPLFPDSVSGVVFQPGAFTAVADGQIWLDPDDSAKQAVLDALSGWDPSGEALYYFNPATATSKWIWSRPQIKTIGEHIFTK